jgi:hypothetical protein
MELDEQNEQFNAALDFVIKTNKLVYLTGKAGTGKTTFLKTILKRTAKHTVVLAPTGVAAINAGGQTIHSFFQIKPALYIPGDRRLRTNADPFENDKSTIYENFRYFKEKLELIMGMELLIIDEVSMVRADLIDVIDRLLRVFRKNEHEPFGGVQVLLIGDAFQLSPITKPDEWNILREFYTTPYFFGAKVMEENKLVYIELKKIYRQNDKSFIALLNKIRNNEIDYDDLEILNEKYNPSFSNVSNHIILATHNAIVDSTNNKKLAELNSTLKTYIASVTGTFNENNYPGEKLLQLKEGAQIMFTKNDKGKRFYNGKIAKIKKLEDHKITIGSENEKDIIIERETWENIRYKWNHAEHKIEEEITGTFKQFPVRLAWAITIHKSQGLGFENVIVDAGASFTAGQVYVALSRCISFEGLVLKTRIPRSAIITDAQVIEFSAQEISDDILYS